MSIYISFPVNGYIIDKRNQTGYWSQMDKYKEDFGGI